MNLRATVASAAALIALTASAVALSASPALAASCGGSQGQALLLGCDNNTATDSTVLAVSGFNTTGLQVQDSGASSIGLYGSATNTGVEGVGGSTGVYGGGSTGVYGNGSTYGVEGHGTVNGMFGGANNSGGSGVYGQNDGTGYGVAGRAANGTGVLADSASGTALKVSGVASFSRSGKATVTAASGKPYVQVSLGNLKSSTFVVATVQGNPAGIWVKSVAVTPASSYFRIYLNKTPTVDVRVGWFVLG